MKLKHKVCTALVCLAVVAVKTWPAEPEPTTVPPVGSLSSEILLVQGYRSLMPEPGLPSMPFPAGVNGYLGALGSNSQLGGFAGMPLLGSSFVTGTRLASGGFAGGSSNPSGFNNGIQGGLSVGVGSIGGGVIGGSSIGGGGGGGNFSGGGFGGGGIGGIGGGKAVGFNGCYGI